jgi:hypothetical protein
VAWKLQFFVYSLYLTCGPLESSVDPSPAEYQDLGHVWREEINQGVFEGLQFLSSAEVFIRDFKC